MAQRGSHTNSADVRSPGWRSEGAIDMIASYRVEMSKQFRRARTYVALGIVVILPIIMTIAVKYGGRGRRADNPEALFQLARGSGLVMPAAALLFMSRFLLIVVVAIFAGDAVAGEASWGNLRYVLVRPIGRSRLLGAKLAMAASFVVIATLLIVGTGLIAGGLAFGYHRIDVDFGFGGGFALHESVGQLLGHLMIASGYVAWSMSAAVALAFMVSTMTDASTGAIGAGVGFYVVSQILDAIPQLGAMRYGFPTHYLDDWRALIVQNTANSDLIRGVLVQLPYIIVFCGIAFWWFRRKDILS
jgi:ABC-2 type transport system permease protein